MRLIKDGEKGVWRWVEREIVYLSIHCRHQNDFCVKLAAMRAILMFHNCEGQSHKTVSTDPEEKGEPKRIRTEVLDLLLTSLTPYR